MPLRFLLIDAIDPLAELERRYPSLGLGYLASALRSRFGRDAFHFKIVYEHVARELTEFRPDIVGIRCVSQNYGRARAYAQMAKRRGLPVLIGGVHISAVPTSLSRDMDVAVIGEGEETIVELLGAFIATGRLDTNRLGDIQGLAYWHDGQVNITQARAPILHLDDIPFPARDLLSIDMHTYMFTSRGCPYRCIFCFSTRYWPKVRFASAEYVVNEIKEIISSYHVSLISFYDDLFIADRQRLEQIASLLEAGNIVGKVRFSCNCRANLLGEDTVRLLKRMGIVSVSMGLESGSDRILKSLKGEQISVADNERAVALLNKYGIAANASFVIGSPMETREEILQTLDFIKSNDLSYVDVYMLTPLPGTPIWEYAESRGLVSDSMDWEKLNINFGRNPQNAIVLSETLTRDDLLQLYRLFQRQRLIIGAKRTWRHPYVQDLPKFALNVLRDRLRRCAGREV
jgi:anaerobic magnesium-protoporphyrin IX monomethyl ester cyclase